MDIIDDVLDLKDSLGETVQKGMRGAKRMLRGEGGYSTFVMVLVILALGAIIITPLLVFVVTGQKAGRTHNEVTHRLYAADTGIQDAMWRISSGDLPEWMQGVWGSAEYSNPPLSYSLPQPINGCDVTVEIGAQWLLEGLETLPNGATPHQGWMTMSTVITPGHYQIIMIFDKNKTEKLERVGCFLPAGFEYTPGSSNLENLPQSHKAYMVPDVSDHQGGQVVIWDWDKNNNDQVEYSYLPGGETRKVVEFDYTPAAGIRGTFSWSRSNSSDIYLSWSGDIKLFRISATATNPDNGLSTTVIAGNMTDESLGTSIAFYGDYAVTGNALVRDQDGGTASDPGRRYRERLYKESPGVLSGIPESATPRKILLYWTGWKSFPANVWSESSADVTTWTQEHYDELQALAANYKVNVVSLKVRFEGTSTTYNLTEFAPVTADTWTVLPNGSYSGPNGWSYSCRADITELVKGYFSDIGVDYVGNAIYTVGHYEIGGSPPSEEVMQGIWGSDNSNVFTVGDSGTIVYYDGETWQIQPSGTTRDFKGVWGSASDNVVYAVGTSGIIRRYNGTSWSGMTSGTNSVLYGIWGTAADDVYAVGSSGAIRHYNGTSWSGMTSGTNRNLYGVWGDSSHIYAVGQSGTILRCAVGSTTWTPMASGTTKDLYGIWGSAADNIIYAVGLDGTILRYAGTTWSGMTSGTTEDLRAIWGSGVGDVYAVGTNGKIIHYDGVGSIWSDSPSGSIHHLYGVWGSGPSDVYVVGDSTGTASTILHWDGSAWSAVSGGYRLYGWVDGHSGETVVGQTDYRLGDNAPVPIPWGLDVSYEWAYSSWSVMVLYTSPETLPHQMYLFDTFRYCNSYGTLDFKIDGFLAPESVKNEAEAARLTCFVGEGDSIYTGDNIYLNNYLLNNMGPAIPANNVWNGVSNAMTYSPDGLDLDTFSVSYPTIGPMDSEANLRISTGIDVWNVTYIMLSFRSDIVGNGLVSYIVL